MATLTYNKDEIHRVYVVSYVKRGSLYNRIYWSLGQARVFAKEHNGLLSVFKEETKHDNI